MLEQLMGQQCRGRLHFVDDMEDLRRIEVKEKKSAE